MAAYESRNDRKNRVVIRKQNSLTLTFWALIMILVLLVYDGALRKWAAPDYERYIYLVKDFILLAAVFLASYGRAWSIKSLYLPKLFLIPFSIYGFYVVFEILNPALPSTLVGIWGLKNHLFYSLLAFTLLASGLSLGLLFEALRKLLPWIVVPVCFVALAQTVSSTDSWLNNPVRGGEFYVSAMANNLVRTSATFSYITGFAWYLQVVTLICVLLLLRCVKRDWVLSTCLVLLLVSVPTNGSRAVIVFLTVSIPLLVAAAWMTNLLETVRIVRISVVLIILGSLSYLAFPEAWGAIIHRFVSSSSVPGDSARYWTIFTNAFIFFDVAGPFGFGVGSASQAAPFLVPSVSPYSWLPSGIGTLGFEEESGRLVLELGVVGWAISFAFRLSMVILSLKILSKAQTSDSKWAAAMGLPLVLYATYVGQGIFAPPIGMASFWFGVGLLLMAWREGGDVGLLKQKPQHI